MQQQHVLALLKPFSVRIASTLCKNLTKIVEEILARCRAEIRQALKPPEASSSESQEEMKTRQASAPPGRQPNPDILAGSAHLARHAERADRYQQLLTLQKGGLTMKEIARRLGMAERTVRYWLKRGIPYGQAELVAREVSGLILTSPM